MDIKLVEKATGAISDKYRLSILMELSKCEVMTCSDVQRLTGLSQPCVSHHVKQLTESTLLASKKEGRNLFLRLNKESIQELSAFLQALT